MFWHLPYLPPHESLTRARVKEPASWGSSLCECVLSSRLSHHFSWFPPLPRLLRACLCPHPHAHPCSPQWALSVVGGVVVRLVSLEQGGWEHQATGASLASLNLSENSLAGQTQTLALLEADFSQALCSTKTFNPHKNPLCTTVLSLQTRQLRLREGKCHRASNRQSREANSAVRGPTPRTRPTSSPC